MELNFAALESALRRHLEGASPSEFEIVHTRSGNRGGLLRMHLADVSIVIKTWSFRNMKEWFKAAAYLSNGRREWQVHRLLYGAGIHVPEPLFFRQITFPVLGRYEIMAVEDIVDSESGVQYIKRLIANGQEKKIVAFENQVIEITSELLRMRILDVDNHLNNFLIDASERVVRIDFECARRRYIFSLHQFEYATMLDRLLRSHLHAAHPESERTGRFMSRVATKLSIPTNIRQIVARITRTELQKESKKTGIDYVINLKW